MSLETHRSEEFLGGIVYLLTIDMRGVTGDPTHIRRYVNNYGADGTGVAYGGVQYLPYPYRLSSVKKNQSTSTSTNKISIGDNEDYEITRFKDEVGGSLENARVTELKVFGRFLDGGVDPNSLAYVKRLDNIIDYIEDSETIGEIIIHTVDPLSGDTMVPSITFSAGVPNASTGALNVFPAADRSVVDS